MRFLVPVLAILLLAASDAFAFGDRLPDERQLAALEARAAAASPREQPYLYAQLIHSMSELATFEYQQGESQQASITLHRAQTYAGRIHATLLSGARRLRNAEILIRRTAFRLRQLLPGAGVNERPTLEATIEQLNQVQSEILSREFQK